MQIKSITLHNFRSYGEEPTRIEFDRGILLFEGDIGSGKSSILYAIEFALFGLGEMEAKYILRGSAPLARVELEFQIGDSEYRVVRTIERKKGRTKTTIDSRGWISERGEKEYELTTTELKSRIMQLLNFREKLGKSSSRIYRFAIFTPQELMKEVLAQKPDERIETLRRAFGIEDYSFANANSDIVASHLENKTKVLSEFTKSLPGKEEDLKKTKAELEKSERDLSQEQANLEELSDKVLELETLLSSIEAERDRACDLQTLIPEIEKGLEETKKQYSDCKAIIETYKENMKEARRAKLLALRLKQDYDGYQKSRLRQRELEDSQDRSIAIEMSIADLTKKVSSKEAALNTQLSLKKEAQRKIEKNISSLNNEIAQLSELDARSKDLRSKSAHLAEVQKESNALNLEVGGESARKQNAVSKVEEYTRELENLDGISSKSEFCPLCKQKLTAEHLMNVRKEYDLKISAAGRDISTCEAKLSELNEKARTLDLKITSLHRVQMELEEITRKIAKLQKAQELEEAARREAAQIEADVATLTESLETRDFVHETEVELSSLRLKRDNLAPNLRELGELKSHMKQLEASNIE
ncbi:MAG: AAA family ATPase, partial [Rhabdochlamydiaceae bacterium]